VALGTANFWNLAQEGAELAHAFPLERVFAGFLEIATLAAVVTLFTSTLV
jgi:hypothetical protein